MPIFRFSLLLTKKKKHSYSKDFSKIMYKSIGNFQEATIEENMSNLTSAISCEASTLSSCNRNQPLKKKRNQPGHPDPGAEVIALSPRSLLATNRFVCEVCNKGFQRDQNLQLHRRGHNLPWKLKQRSTKEVRKKVYICPEIGCVHHDASRALGDLTGIKKHFYRKHGEKKWKCDKCSKKYAVQSDWKAHSKICGTREYRCDCGTVFSRRDSFITHRAFCEALAQENGRSIITTRNNNNNNNNNNNIPIASNSSSQILSSSQFNNPFQIKKENFIPPWLIGGPNDLITPTPPLIFQDNNNINFNQPDNFPNPNPSTLEGPTALYHPPASPYISATALLQKASQVGSLCTQFQSPGGVFISPHSQSHVTGSTAGFGSSRDEFIIQGLASYGSKAAPAATGSTETGAPLGGNSSSLIHEMMMTGFEGSAFDDVAFGEMKDGGAGDGSFHATVGQFSSEGGDNMTRDFLGLRPLSQSEILSISGLDNCMNNNSCNDNN